MQLAQSWLTEILQHGTPGWTRPSTEIDEAFVRVGFEIEEITPLPVITGPLVIGRVEHIEQLTEFKKPIRFCQVDVGESEPRGIVCGAQNFAEGDLIVAALPGSVLPGDFAIAARTTYGKTSDGMICSVSEMGIGNDHSGILVLPPEIAAPGADAREVLGLNDTIIDVNVTPDRGYAFSARGLSRELACSFDLPFVDPATAPSIRTSVGESGWPVHLDPESGATRYCALVVRGIDPTVRSPWWMAKRLMLSGVRPISAAVDITNYVMLELGQPLHAFDAGKISGDIRVRRAHPGEQLITLDDTTRMLDPEDVVITDDSGPIALAGVMGGAATEIGAQSADVLLEAATFDPVAVFRTAKRHRLTSEASKRFERVVDPKVTDVAVLRAAQLLVEICGGTVESTYTDAGSVPPPATVLMAEQAPSATAGIEYPVGVAQQRLVQVGATVEVAGEMLAVTPPSWRPDLRQSADLVEEVLRLEGYENIPVQLPTAPGGRGLAPRQIRRRSVGRSLALSGYVEVLPYPFMPAGVFDLWNLPVDDPRRDTVTVLNPLEADRPALNTTLLPGLLEMVGRNLARGQRDLSMYTIGQVVLGGGNVRPVPQLPVDRRPSAEQISELVESLPAQPLHVAAVLTGLREPAGPWGKGRAADTTDIFDAVTIIGQAAGVELTLKSAAELPWHPGRCAQILAGGAVVGWAGELHPAVLERSHLPARSLALEIDLDAVPVDSELVSPRISPYPPVLQDLAVVVDADVAAEDVRAALREGAGDLLESIGLFDVFTGDQVGEGRKSLTFSLRFRATDRTLTEDEATAARDAALAKATSAVGAQIRG
ncbi:MAG: phenylalanine--tRNA ligase subunit beta [Gordonia sp.]|nr:phenylalanine--tRNA ligase subunit beta [Gordonia sp. (in: high G+C Gram-positive bacteria)]